MIRVMCLRTVLAILRLVWDLTQDYLKSPGDTGAVPSPLRRMQRNRGPKACHGGISSVWREVQLQFSPSQRRNWGTNGGGCGWFFCYPTLNISLLAYRMLPFVTSPVSSN